MHAYSVNRYVARVLIAYPLVEVILAWAKMTVARVTAAPAGLRWTSTLDAHAGVDTGTAVQLGANACTHHEASAAFEGETGLDLDRRSLLGYRNAVTEVPSQTTEEA